jgi:hypothetical protein
VKVVWSLELFHFEMRERLRVWIEAVETFFIEVVVEKRRGTGPAIVRAILPGLFKVWLLVAVRARPFLYNVRSLMRRRRRG